MRALNLDYQRSVAAPAGIGIGVLAAGLALAVAVTVQYWRLSDELSATEARLAQAQRSAPAPRAAGRIDDKEMQQAVRAASAVAQELSRPWDALFRALENAKTEDVALLAIEPDATKGMVRITGEARQRQAMLDYIARLDKEAVLQDVFLVEHQIQQQVAEKPIRFSLAALWVRKS